MRIRVTQELTGAWEVWEYDVPVGTDLTDLSAVPLDNGLLVDSGFDSLTHTAVEPVASGPVPSEGP